MLFAVSQASDLELLVGNVTDKKTFTLAGKMRGTKIIDDTTSLDITVQGEIDWMAKMTHGVLISWHCPVIYSYESILQTLGSIEPVYVPIIYFSNIQPLA